MRECNKIIETINHFFGHLEIECTDSLGLCGIEYKEYVENKKEEIIDFCKNT